MHVKGLIWLGMRTTQFEEMVKFFRDVMGMQPIRDEPELAGFQLTNGTQVELYRPEEEFHAFFTTGPVVAFRWTMSMQHEPPWKRQGSSSSAPFSGQVRRVGITSEPRMGRCLRS
jgi:catechol 2,3-dioxygenase-like lactoylglutathione lyase family enzyme